jgi:prolipoprotein diacylglyceryltransferase
MLRIGIDPVALHIGFFSVRWYGVIVVTAIAFLTIWLVERIKTYQQETTLPILLTQQWCR